MSEEENRASEIADAIEKALGTSAPNELYKFAVILAKVANGEITPEQAQKEIGNNKDFARALSELTGKTISTDKTQLAFGTNSQLGDVSVHDVIGGNSVHLTFNIAQNTPENKNRQPANNLIYITLIIILIGLIGTVGWAIFSLQEVQDRASSAEDKPLEVNTATIAHTNEQTFFPSDTVTASHSQVTNSTATSALEPSLATLKEAPPSETVDTSSLISTQVQATIISQNTNIAATQDASNTITALVAATATAQYQQDANLTAIALTSTAATNENPALQRSLQWDILFQDTFSDTRGGWFTGDYAVDRLSGNITVEDGLHKWSVMAFREITWWLRPTIEPIADFALTVDMQKANGPLDNSYGVIFRLREDDGFSYYRFRVNDLQEYEVSFIDKNGTDAITPWTRAEYIQPGEVNRITVIGEGDQFSLYVNGQLLASFSDDRLASGQVGIILGTTSSNESLILSDNFEVRSP